LSDFEILLEEDLLIDKINDFKTPTEYQPKKSIARKYTQQSSNRYISDKTVTGQDSDVEYGLI